MPRKSRDKNAARKERGQYAAMRFSLEVVASDDIRVLMIGSAGDSATSFNELAGGSAHDTSCLSGDFLLTWKAADWSASQYEAQYIDLTSRGYHEAL